jgi:hypothetical protein
LSSVITAVGNKPVYPYLVPDSEANAYVIDPGGIYAAASYDSIVTGGHFNNIAQWAGSVPFTVQLAIPGLLDFWAIQPGTGPDHLIGTFTATTNGVLTFVAGPRASSVLGVTRAGNINTVQFTTTVGNTYSLAYTNQLGGSVTNWPVVGGTQTGDGRTDSLTRTNAGNVEFYRIITQ